MSDRYRVVGPVLVDMRPAAPTPPAPPEPYRVVDGAVVPMRPWEPLDYLPQARLALWGRLLRAGYGGASFLATGGPADEEVGFLPQGVDGGGALDRQFLVGYGGGDARVSVGRDQSGRGADLSRRLTLGPGAASEGAPECEGPTPVWRFSGGAALSRADALGLAADPALTLAWKMRGPRDYDASPRALLALGSAPAPELVLASQCGPDGDRVLLAGPAPSLSAGASWSLPAGTLLGWHSYVVTKPAATGYYAHEWRLRVDGFDVGPPSFASGVLALGAGLTQLGACPGVLPAEAQLAGLIAWDSVLDADSQLPLLQRFLDGELPGSSFSPPTEPFALGEDGVFWVLDGAYLSWA